MQSNQWRSQDFAPEGRGSTGDWTPTAPQGAPRQAMGPCGRPGVPCRPGALQHPRPPTPASATRAPRGRSGNPFSTQGTQLHQVKGPRDRPEAPAAGPGAPAAAKGAPEPPQGAPHGRPWATVADQGGTAAGQGPPQPPIGGPEALPKYEGPKDHLQELAEQQRSSTRRLNARNPATNPQTPIGSGAPKPARGASGPPGPPLGYASF